MSILIMVFILYQMLLEFEINMLYINCVCVLKACFEKIDENVAHLQKIIVKPCISTLTCQRIWQRNQFLLIELKILKKQHLVISDTVQMLNEIFNLQLLATIAITFFVITFEIYCDVVRWQGGILINFDMQFIFALFTTVGHYTMKITWLVWACETGKNQAQEISTTVHGLLNSTNDEQIKNELQLFSLQILHRKNIFSTKGLTVDATLLAIIVGNITTYLIILIQFLHMSHSCDGKTAINITQSN
ncbi:putative gustatory receptor 28b [Mycetomoellerius zeteki]|nr:PREDICTED: putative gustatory receptor 28b [Trachymyrmex zeteki]